MSTLTIILPSRNESGVDGFVKELERRIPVSQIIIANDKESKGKGYTIRQALEYATGDLICFLDGDGEIPARMVLRLLPFLEDFDVAVGSKRITHSPPRRKIMTHLTRIWFRFLFGVQVDTQTGIKIFRRSALEALDWNWESNYFIFDVEILEKLQRKGFKLVEVPIECEIKKQLAVKTIFKIFGESLWLKSRLLFRTKKKMNTLQDV